jgi:hypothetical protein
VIEKRSSRNRSENLRDLVDDSAETGTESSGKNENVNVAKIGAGIQNESP